MMDDGDGGHIRFKNLIFISIIRYINIVLARHYFTTNFCIDTFDGNGFLISSLQKT